MPIISVVIPVYNTCRYIKRCLDSICNQTLKDLEVIIVDDGSTDDSELIYSSYINSYENFILIKKENGGLSSARYAGFKKSTSEFIVFIDSDDYIEPTYCEDLYNACVSNNCDLAICGYSTIKSDKKDLQPLCYTSDIITKLEITKKYILPIIAHSPKSRYNIPSFLWMRMMKRERITEACFIHENEVFSEDLVFNLKYVEGVSKIAVINKHLYNYCYNENSLSNRYRDNGWQMKFNLYKFCLNYCIINKIPNAEYRLQNNLLYAMLYGVQNASKLSYSLFSHELKTIKNNPICKKVLHQTHCYLLKKNLLNFKLLIILLKYIHPYIIYHFYKWRQSR